MIAAFMVLRVLTTLAAGHARWICSARLSVLTGLSGGGIVPAEKSSGLATSIRILPARFSAPAAASTSRLVAPELALTTASARPAASANAARSTAGWSRSQAENGCPAEPAPVPVPVRARVDCVSRVPTTTSWPSEASLAEMVLPTLPVPSTA